MNSFQITTHSPADPKIPFLETALDLQQAKAQFQAVRSDIHSVTAANLIRHKFGRRALIEYHLKTDHGPLTLIGKIRAKGTDRVSYHVQKNLWNRGFDTHSADGYSVPEPMGMIPNWQMWLQRKVRGIPATELLPMTNGVVLCRRIAALAHRLHCTPISTPRQQTLRDELSILHTGLTKVSQQYPHWQSRIEQILIACDTLVSYRSSLSGEQINDFPLVGIHRDFYSDQILVDGARLWLVDFDLYCQGHPALDIGNFIAHITEQSIRQTGNPAAMADREVALRDTFIDASVNARSDPRLSAEDLHHEIELYSVLALVRHIYISTRINARNHCTEAILALCETRLQNILEQDTPSVR
ncbi:MAG: phosphotransferase [Cyanobacteria bacterium P01_H01_bin.26]